MEGGSAWMRRQSRAARRLARLFKIERNGGFERRSAGTIARLIERRGRLVEALLTVGPEPRPGAADDVWAEYHEALAALAQEVDHARDRVQKRLEEIGKDLRLSRGEGLATGIRNNTSGRPLGKT